MNDLRGILSFLMLGLSFVASENFECRKHFKCVNSTYFNVCVDFGDGKLWTIEGLVLQCPPRFVCEETNINECQLPLVTTTIPPSTTPTSLPDESSTILNISEASNATRLLSTQTSDNRDEAPLNTTIYGVNKEDSKIIKDITNDNLTASYLITEKTIPMKTNYTTKTSLEDSTNSNVPIQHIEDLEVNGSAKIVSNSFDTILANYTITSSTKTTISEKHIPAINLNITNNLTNTDVFIRTSNETTNNKILPSHLDMNINILLNKDVIKSNNNTTVPTFEENDLSSNNISEINGNRSYYDIHSHNTELTTPIYIEPTQTPNMNSAEDINKSFLVNLPFLTTTDQTENVTTTTEGYVSDNVTYSSKIGINETNKKDNVIDFIPNGTSTTFFSETEKPPLLFFDTITESIGIVSSDKTTEIKTKNNFTQIEYLYSDNKKNVSTELVEVLQNSTARILPTVQNKTNETTTTKITNIYEITPETVTISNNLSTEQTTGNMTILENKNTTMYIDSVNITHNNITKSFTENNTNEASNDRVNLRTQLINRTENLTKINIDHFSSQEMNTNISYLVNITTIQSLSGKDVEYTTAAYKENITIKDEQPLQTEATVTYIPLVITETVSKKPLTPYNVSEKNNKSNNYLLTKTNSDSPLLISSEIPTTQSNLNFLNTNILTLKKANNTTTSKLENTTDRVTIHENLTSLTEHREISNNVTEVNEMIVGEIKTSNTFDTTTETITTTKSFTEQIITTESVNTSDNVVNVGNTDNIKSNITQTIIIKMSNEYNGTRNGFNESVGALSMTHVTKDNYSQAASNQLKTEFKTLVEQDTSINKTSSAINGSGDFQMNENGDKSMYNSTISSVITKDYNKYSDMVQKKNAFEYTGNITTKEVDLLSTEAAVTYIPLIITETITVTPSTIYYNAFGGNNNESNNNLTTKTNSAATTLDSYTEEPTTRSISTRNEDNINSISKSKYTTQTIFINKEFLPSSEGTKVSNDVFKNEIRTSINKSYIGEVETIATFDNTKDIITTTMKSSTEMTTTAAPYSSTVNANTIIINSDKTITTNMSNNGNESRNGFTEILTKVNNSASASNETKNKFKTTTEGNTSNAFIEQIITINNTYQEPKKSNFSVGYQINDNETKPIYNPTTFSLDNKDINKHSDILQNKDAMHAFPYTENITKATITHNVSVITEIIPVASTTMYNVSKDTMNKVNSIFITTNNTETSIMKPLQYMEANKTVKLDVTTNTNIHHNTVFKSKLENATDTTSVNEDLPPLMLHESVSTVSKDINWTPIKDTSNVTTEIMTTTIHSHIEYNLSDTVTNHSNKTIENSTENYTISASTPVDQITTLNDTYTVQVLLANNNVLKPSHATTTYTSGMKDDGWQKENNTVFANDTINNYQQLSNTMNFSPKATRTKNNINGTLEYNDMLNIKAFQPGQSLTMPARKENDIMNISTNKDTMTDIPIVNEQLSPSIKDVTVSSNVTESGKWTPINSLNVEEVKTIDIFDSITKIIRNTTSTNASSIVNNSLIKNLNNSALGEIANFSNKSLTKRTVKIKKNNCTVIPEAIDNTKNNMTKSFTERTIIRTISDESKNVSNFTEHFNNITNQSESILETTTENIIVTVNVPVKQNTTTNNTVQADEFLTNTGRKTTFSNDYRTNNNITKLIYDPLNSSGDVNEYSKLVGVKNASVIRTETFALEVQKSTTESSKVNNRVIVILPPNPTTAYIVVTEENDHNLDATTEYSIAYPAIEKPMETIARDTSKAIRNENGNIINKSPANSINSNDNLADAFEIKNGIDMVHDVNTKTNNDNGTSSLIETTRNTDKPDNPNKLANVSKALLDIQQSSSIQQVEEQSSKVNKTSNVMILKESRDTASINKKLYHSQYKNNSEKIKTSSFNLHNTTMNALHTAENKMKIETTTDMVKMKVQKMYNSTEIKNKDINYDSKSKLINSTEIITQQKIGSSELSPNIMILEKPTTNNRNKDFIDAQQQTTDIEIFETFTLNRNYITAEFTTQNILQKIILTTNKTPILQQKTGGNDTLKLHPLNQSSSLKYDCSQRSPGKYADNDDCRTFYICIAKRYPIIKKCSENTVFSEIRKHCTKDLSHCVRNNEFQCPSEGRFSDISKDNVYYICDLNKLNKFIKFKFQCQEGFHLNKSSVKCVNDHVTSTIPSVSKDSGIESSSEINTTPSVSSSTERESTEDIKCKKEGKFGDPYDCRKYYECSEKNDRLRKKIKKCGSDEVFDINKKSMNIVTPRVSSETSIESNNRKINGEGSEESRSLSSIQNFDSEERPITFDCRRKSRRKYADQNDCKTYYVCIDKHSPLVRKCPDDTVFSEIENKCTKKLSHCIRQNEFICIREGKFIDILKDNYFYICARHNVNHYMRFHLKCEDDFQLDIVSMKCTRKKENTEFTPVSAQIIKENHQDNGKSGKLCQEEGEFNCQEEGKFSAPQNCRKYYVCSKKHGRFRKQKKKCKRDEVFHKEKKKCISAESYECSFS